jgi:hypothetical protein
MPIDATRSISPSIGSPLSPLVAPIDDIAITSHPATDPSDRADCKVCKKPVLKSTLQEHVKNCLKIKAEKAKERKLKKEAKEKAAAAKEAGKDKDDEKKAKTNGTSIADDVASLNGDAPEKVKGGKKSAVKNTDDGDKKSKKRKADAESKKAPKAKKKKEEAKPKTAKPKGMECLSLCC